MPKIEFPKGFLWGAATSSYQIEGAVHEDGRGESIWDLFARQPGTIDDGSNGDVACDHYHRYSDDVSLMRDLHFNTYRFSIAWPRILPEGRGKVNPKGVDFYKRLVDELLNAGITPFATLFHWDLPVPLQTVGGWPVRATADAFVEYADVITRALGDRVHYWTTINEPWCASFLSYQLGEHAPGLKDWRKAVQASHHLLLAHGWAVPVIRKNCPGAEVAVVLNFSPSEPASASHADADATRRFDGYFNRWFIDPIYGREYPADVMTAYRESGYVPADRIQPGDMDAIAAPTDFLAVNYYNRSVHRADIPAAKNLPVTNHLAPKSEWTDCGWEIYPDGLYNILCRLHFEYQIPKIIVAENGAAYNDSPDEKGRIRDARRVAYLRSHLLAVHRAIQAGAPVAGYLTWSILDNFEWARGYSQRFGLVWVDFETQQRLLKDSALWYQLVCNENGFDDPA